MKLVLPLIDLETSLGPNWLHPLALLPLADSVVLGQLLQAPLRASVSEVLFLSRAGEGEIAGWAAKEYPSLRMQFITLPQAINAPHALWLARTLWDNDALLLVDGGAVVEAELAGVAETESDVVCLIHPAAAEAGAPSPSPDGNRLAAITAPGEQSDHHGAFPTGVYYFHRGRRLREALEAWFHEEREPQPDVMAGRLLHHLLAQGRRIVYLPADAYLPLPRPQDDLPQAVERLLAANSRLLGLGRSTENVIERSYQEDFTALPPVYLDETAVIDSSVIGPYTSIGRGSVVRNSIVRRSIIGPGTSIADCVLDGAVIGEAAGVAGLPLSPVVADGDRFVPGD